MRDLLRPPSFPRRAALSLLLAAPAHAQSRPAAPTGPVLLSVTGRITRPNRGAQADFDRAMLEALPRHRLQTGTNWTSGIRSFEGPLARDVLAAAGAEGERVRAVALNDYTIEIPMRDFTEYDVILAMRMDGQVLTVRNKGPVWVVYPRDHHSELRVSLYDSRWIWQLRTMQVL
ncbi:molybdopterin-dependent oxidoreductase [Roseomonas sp. SSH11]|uniref:Molybdopterin-dependent oxidoreductase n=1 Tax=Pararoseomonas baculiformis TaxID=2820812 RepID=A0ABS4AJB6_9PROT|nr:molybdopterin-dependent oxidoreductase [Pararoseomonas baculiformis]MBP0447118.1 molybdopterin-dependent oxidoreductase [Pararoseomonas baculiformis]